jgi:hypothetical protein
MKNPFSTMETKIHELQKEDSDVLDSNHKEETSCFQHKTGFQMIQLKDHVTPTQGVHQEGLSQRQIQRAEKARTLQAKLGCPSMKDYKWVIQANKICDYPVTVEDVEIANKIIWQEHSCPRGARGDAPTPRSGARRRNDPPASI